MYKKMDLKEKKERFEKIKAEWNYNKNRKNPDAYTYGSSCKVWWKCLKGHEWEATIQSRVRGDNCPYCSGRRVIKGETDLKTIHPSLAKEWDYENNESDIREYYAYSNKKVYWICSKGHRWSAKINDRVRGNGCPYCAGKKIIEGENDFASQCPQLALEWNYRLNTKKPNEYSYGSGQKVWWVCKKGHEWQSQIKDRVRGNGCPYCAGKRIVVGENDLATLKPWLSLEWDYEKNSQMKPEDFTCGSSTKVWWKCEKGHSWQARIYSRSYGIGCPYCAGERVIVGYNDLASQEPDLVKEWDWERNGEQTPNEICVNSSKMINWICKYGHCWTSSPNQRVSNRTGCPICSRQFHTSFPEQAIYFYCKKFYREVENMKKWKSGIEIDIFIKEIGVGIEYDGEYWHSSDEAKRRENKKDEFCTQNGIKLLRVKEANIENIKVENNILQYNPKIKGMLNKVIKTLMDKLEVKNYDIDVERDRADIYQQYKIFTCGDITEEEIRYGWDINKNGNLRLEMFTKGSHQMAWWKCEKGHSYQMEIKSHIGNMHSGCPVCASKQIIVGENDFASLHQELLNEWNYEKNTHKPYEYTEYSGKKVWWKCKKGHEWQTSIAKRVTGQKCPFCQNKRVWKGYNDLLTCYPQIAREWNDEKNGDLLPSEVVFGSTKKVWWRCKAGHEWSTKVYLRTLRGTKCPICYGQKR